MPALPGWARPGHQRRDVVRAAPTSLLPSPARSRRATAAAGSTLTLLPRLALWLGIGGLVVLFGMASDGSRVATVTIPAAFAAITWRQLTWPARTVVVLGLVWLSLAQLGLSLGLGLDVLLAAWWWLPTQVGSAQPDTTDPADPAEPETLDLVPLAAAYDPLGGNVPTSVSDCLQLPM